MTIARRAALAALLATPALTAATRAHAQGAEIGTAARPLKMGVTAGPHAQVMEMVRDIAAKDGLVIRIIEFTDYIQPNVALASGDLTRTPSRPSPFWNSR